MGVTKKFSGLRLRERRKRPLLENTFLFLFKFYKQPGSGKISITIKIDRINLRVIKHQVNQVRKYIISLSSTFLQDRHGYTGRDWEGLQPPTFQDFLPFFLILLKQCLRKNC